MQITAATSFDSFIAARATPQAAGNGDNESFARLMQERQAQAQAAPAPSPAPASAPASADDGTTSDDAAARADASTSDARASASREPRDAERATARAGDAGATQNATDAKSLAQRRADAAKLDKRTSSAGDVHVKKVVATDTTGTADTSTTATSTGDTSAAAWLATLSGVAPKQPPIVPPADGSDPAATTGTGGKTRLTAGLPDVPIQGDGSTHPPIGLAPGPQPVQPTTQAIGTRLPGDQNPISLTPTTDVAVKAEKAALAPAADDPSMLAMLQSAAMPVTEPAKTDKPAANESTGSIDGVAAAAAAGGVAPSTSRASETPTVQIATPVHAPEFKAALGVQVSMMARDGVQHAELHLNPADMGPISVQIATEGTQARVDFGADSAATRQILEAGLPELASALQSAGLTLTGGGVSQHSQGGSQGSGGSREQGRGSRQATIGVEGASSLGAATAGRTQRGALDLYA